MIMTDFLSPEEYNIENVFSGKYYIPIYQRPYSWNTEQVKQLLNDIDEAYENSKNKSNTISPEKMLLFVGTIFIKIQKN